MRSGDLVVAPDGSRRGMVRCTYPDGISGGEPGRTTVQFQAGSVRALGGSALPRPWSWVTADDDAEWQLAG